MLPAPLMMEISVVASVVGGWFHLSLILYVYSCKNLGHEEHDSDDALHVEHLVRRLPKASPPWNPGPSEHRAVGRRDP